MSRRAISACFSWSRDLHHTAGSGHLFTQKFRRAVSGTVHHIRWAWVFLACISITGPASLVDAQTHYPPWILVMSEGFEGSFPSAGWSVADLNGGDEHLWGRDSSWSHSGSGWAAWAARDGADGIFSSLGYYPDWVNTAMKYGPFDLSAASGALLEFAYSHISPEDEDYLCWQASIDDINYHGYCVSGDHNNWNLESFDLTSVPTLGDLTGESQVWIRFHFTSDDTDNAYQGPWVDSINLWAYPAETVTINEIDTGTTDAIEFYNGGDSAVDMTGMYFAAYDSGGGINRNYTFPTFTLSSDSYVVLHEGTGIDTVTSLYLGGSIGWLPSDSGAVELAGIGSLGVDFVRWGSSTMTPPAGTSWTGSNPPGPPNNQSIGRDPNGTDSDDGGDWCQQAPSLSNYNNGCLTTGGTVINEIDVGGEFLNSSAAIEIHNPGGAAVELGGWQLSIYHSSGAPTHTYTFATFSLPAGGFVVLHEPSGTDTATDLYLGVALSWDIYSDGAAVLTDGVTGVDFVRWGGSPVGPPAGTNWSGTDPAIPTLGVTLSRSAPANDTDNGSDWCHQTPTLGSVNPSCSGLIFADGFETGGTTNWSKELP